MRISLLLVGAMLTGCNGDPSTGPGGASLCEPLHDGDVVIGNQAQFESVKDQLEVNGDLLFCDTIDLGTARFPNLTRVAGNLIVRGSTSLTNLSLPQLTSLSDTLASDRTWWGLQIESNDVLTTVSLPNLTRLGGHLWVRGNAVLTSMDLPALNYVAGVVTIKETMLTSLDGFANLRAVGGTLQVLGNTEMVTANGFATLASVSNDFVFEDNLKLTDVSAPALRSVGRALIFRNNAAFTTLSLPALRNVDLSVIIDGVALTDLGGLSTLELIGSNLTIQNNAALTDATLPQVFSVASNFDVENNTQLGTLSFPALGFVGGNFTVVDNTVLPTCQADNLVTSIGSANIGGTVTIQGNDDVATCP